MTKRAFPLALLTPLLAAALLSTALLSSGCSSESDEALVESSETAPLPAPNPTKNAYFGDLHVHTRYSFDAFIFGTKADPNDAYDFAKGNAIEHPAGFELKLDRPLDFQAVSDHGMYLGMLPAMTDPDSPAYAHPIGDEMRAAATADERRGIFVGMGPYLSGQEGTEEHLNLDVVRDAWSKIAEAAERHNDPGKFTTFIAYEYTSGGEGRDNLHRNVIFRDSSYPETPFTRLDSSNPEELWSAMDEWRARGIDSLAIPHNSNGSDGRMFERTYYYDGPPIDESYAQQRMRNEPLVEMTQVKGTSDTHPALSPNDEWADFEIMPYKIATTTLSKPEGSYVRGAYLRGLELEESGISNPYKFGLIGSSDTHVAAGSFDEKNYWSKVGLLDAEPALRGSVPGEGQNASTDDPSQASPSSIRTDDGSGRTYRDTYYYTWGASGLAGAWAEENTREAIYQAFKRKETFATSGTRIRVRFFAGRGFNDQLIEEPDFLTQAYERGVAMGGDLTASDDGTAPSFVVWALRDPLAAPLQRVQVVKGWIENGQSRERVFDAACSDALVPDSSTHLCPDNGATVDLSTCDISADSGADELRAVWTDPEFNAEQRAVYYVRVLENPSCRWSTWDALRQGVEPRQDVQATIQERAWSSPIWYTP